MDPAAQDNNQQTTSDAMDDQIRSGSLPWQGSSTAQPTTTSTVTQSPISSLPPLPQLPTLSTVPTPTAPTQTTTTTTTTTSPTVPNQFVDSGLPGPLAEPEVPPPPAPQEIGRASCRERV